MGWFSDILLLLAAFYTFLNIRHIAELQRKVARLENATRHLLDDVA
jgi:hypothetical protein